MNSLNLINGYSGILTVLAPLSVGTLLLNAAPAGGIDQPVSGGPSSDITVTGVFNWTGGILNTTDSGTALHIIGSGLIAPLNAGLVTTYDTLSVEGATTAIQPGIVNFAGGLGLQVSAAVELLANAKVTFSDGTAGKDAGENWIKPGGSITVTGPGPWDSGLPLLNDSGQFLVQGAATATFRAGLVSLTPLKAGTVVQTGATSSMVIENGSTVEVTSTDGSMYIDGGKIATKPTATGMQYAKIVASVNNHGADIVIDDPAYDKLGNGHVFGILTIDGQLNWDKGVFRPFVGWTSADASGTLAADRIEVVGKVIFLSTQTGSLLGPQAIVNAGTRDLKGVTWDIISGDMTLETKPLFETAGQTKDWSDDFNKSFNTLMITRATP